MLKRFMFLPLLLLIIVPLNAQESADSVYEFKFVAEKDMFYVSYRNNRAELERLTTLIRLHHEAIIAGKMPIFVDGYCNSLSGEAENKATARRRSNRVKSELILHEKLKEDCFITHNHPTTGNFVTVKLQIPPALPPALPEPAVTERSVMEEESRQIGTEAEAVTANQMMKELSATASSDGMEHPKSQSSLFLRANLLRWATLTPDLGVEWCINGNMGVLLNGSWTSWSWSDKDKRYALWKLSPEVRYYIGKEKRGFVGAMYHMGRFNYKLGDTGKQGSYRGGGITGGYRLQLNGALALDFNAAIGYTYADYDKYILVRGIRVRRESETKNYLGINQLGVTLVWKLAK